MGKYASSITFRVRQALAAQGIHLSAGHAQQLLAAGFGHNNLASMQASGDADRLDDAEDIVFDVEKFKERASDLEAPADAEEFLAALKAEFPRARHHRSLDNYHHSLQQYVDDAIENDGLVVSQTSMTNGGMPTAEVQLELEAELASTDVMDIQEELKGLVTVEQDPDKVFWGDKVEVEATLYVGRLGRRLFGERRLDVSRARLRWMNEPFDDGDDLEEEDESGAGVPGAEAF